MAPPEVTTRAEPRPGYAPATAREGRDAARACRGCGAALGGPYCAACGQADVPADPTLRELLGDLVDNVLSVDGRLAATFRTLVLRPGELTEQYVRGRRAPFLTPLRVYLLCSVVYFAVAAVTPDPIRTISQPTRDVAAVQAGEVRVTVTGAAPEDSADIARSIEGMRRSPNRLLHYVGEVAYRAQANPMLVKQRADEVLPKIMFVLVPLFAALTAALFRGRFRYPSHLAFALHVHAFTFLALVAVELTKASGSIPAAIAVSALAWAAVLAYLVAAVRRVFSTSLVSALARTAALAAVYFVALMLVRLAGMVVALLLL
jgi:hypothetical protein